MSNGVIITAIICLTVIAVMLIDRSKSNRKDDEE